MKKTILSLMTATALTCVGGAVPALAAEQPPAPVSPVAAAGENAGAQATADTGGSSDNEQPAADGATGEEGSVSQGSSDAAKIWVPVVVAGLAAAGAAYWAVQQGMIPGVTLPGAQPPAPKKGGCSPADIDRNFRWGNSQPTVVSYCDGTWAFAGKAQTDYVVAFKFNGTSWQSIKPAGTTRTGMSRSCYNASALRQQGAPAKFLAAIPQCKPNEIGYFG